MTAQGSAYTRFKRALKTGNAHLALDAAADLQRIGLADALSLLLVIREDKPVLFDKAAVRWFAKYAAENRYLLLRDTRELVDLLDGVGRHDQVASSGLSGGYAPAATTTRPTASPELGRAPGR